MALKGPFQLKQFFQLNSTKTVLFATPPPYRVVQNCVCPPECRSSQRKQEFSALIYTQAYPLLQAFYLGEQDYLQYERGR